MRLCRSSTLFVNSLVSSARSLKLTRKNSSAVFAVLKNCSAASLADFVAHASADVKNHSDRNGHVFGGKSFDLLLDVVFKDAEVVRLEAGDQAVVGVGDRDVDQREAYVAAQYPAGLDSNSGRI